MDDDELTQMQLPENNTPQIERMNPKKFDMPGVKQSEQLSKKREQSPFKEQEPSDELSKNVSANENEPGTSK